jgi:hypothetical protein
VLHIAEGLDLVHLDGDAVGFLPGRGRVVRLNPAAAAIVAAVEAGFSWPEIVATLAELGTPVDADAALAELLEAGVVLRAPERAAAPDDACAPDACADPVATDPAAHRFDVATPSGVATFLTDDDEVADRVGAAIPGATPHPLDGAVVPGWSASAHVDRAADAGGRGPRRLHELRVGGAVVARTRTRDELVEWSVQTLAVRLLAVTPTVVPIGGAVERDGTAVRLWAGDTAEGLRTRRSRRGGALAPLPALVLVAGAARTPAAAAGVVATEPDPAGLSLVVPDGDASSQLARILASVPNDLVRSATTEQLSAAARAVPWVTVRDLRPR